MRLLIAVLILTLLPLLAIEEREDISIPAESYFARQEARGRDWIAQIHAMFAPYSLRLWIPEGWNSDETVKRAGPDPDGAPVLSREELCTTIASSAQAHDIPVAFFSNLIWQESRFDHKAVSRVGAQGVAQFMPAVAESFGVENPFDARQALPASARLLRELLHRFGNFGLAAAAYNAGPRRVMDWLSKPKTKLPKETRDYVLIITGRPAETWRGGKPQLVAFELPQRMPCKQVAAYSEIESAERKQTIADIAAADAAAKIVSAKSAAKAENKSENKKNARARLLAHKSKTYRVASAEAAPPPSDSAKKSDKNTEKKAVKPAGSKKQQTRMSLSAAKKTSRHSDAKAKAAKSVRQATKPHSARPKG